MHANHRLAGFLSSPVMTILGTADSCGRPDIGRAVGCRVSPGGSHLDLVVPERHWPGTIANIRATARTAATFSRPADYETFQVKGAASLRDADADDLALAARYMGDIRGVLAGLGIPPSFSATWLSVEGAVIVTLSIDAVFVQTPGPHAGKALAEA